MTAEVIEQQTTHDRVLYDSKWLPANTFQQNRADIIARMRVRMQYTAHYEAKVDALTQFEWDVAWYQYLDAYPGDTRVRLVDVPKDADLALVYAQGSYAVRV